MTLPAWDKLVQLADATFKPMITNARSLFSSSDVLTHVPGNQLDMTNCISTNSMFNNCSHLTEITGTQDWGFTHLVDATQMFSGCSALERIEGMGNWSMRNVVSMDNMFANTNQLRFLDMTHWDLSNLQSAADYEAINSGSSYGKTLRINGKALKQLYAAQNLTTDLQGMCSSAEPPITIDDRKIYEIDLIYNHITEAEVVQQE